MSIFSDGAAAARRVHIDFSHFKTELSAFANWGPRPACENYAMEAVNRQPSFRLKASVS